MGRVVVLHADLLNKWHNGGDTSVQDASNLVLIVRQATHKYSSRYQPVCCLRWTLHDCVNVHRTIQRGRILDLHRGAAACRTTSASTSTASTSTGAGRGSRS